MVVPYFYPIIVNGMKRKDTKKYQTLVDEYVGNRRFCESRQKEIDDYEHRIDEEERNMDIATVVLRDCGGLLDWVKSLVNDKVGMLHTLVELMKSSQRSAKEDMDKCGSILVSEYDENLDELYAINR